MEFNQSDQIATSVDLSSRVKQESESVGKYYASITSVTKRLFLNMAPAARDQIILSAFVKGLPLTYKRGLLNNTNIKTLNQAFKAAQRMEKTNLILLKDSLQETVNIIETDKNEELKSIKRSLKDLELRQAEIARQNRGYNSNEIYNTSDRCPVNNNNTQWRNNSNVANRYNNNSWRNNSNSAQWRNNRQPQLHNNWRQRSTSYGRYGNQENNFTGNRSKNNSAPWQRN